MALWQSHKNRKRETGNEILADPGICAHVASRPDSRGWGFSSTLDRELFWKKSSFSMHRMMSELRTLLIEKGLADPGRDQRARHKSLPVCRKDESMSSKKKALHPNNSRDRRKRSSPQQLIRHIVVFEINGALLLFGLLFFAGPSVPVRTHEGFTPSYSLPSTGGMQCPTGHGPNPTFPPLRPQPVR